jgi:triacylglycerol lipase
MGISRMIRRLLLLLAGVLIWCHLPTGEAALRGDKDPVPVLLVHGIFSTGECFQPMKRWLKDRGILHVKTVDLSPNDATTSLAVLAAQVDTAVEKLRERHHVARVDVVGYSMGALVARYWLQRLGGRDRTRKFISIAGPQQGVVGAFLDDRPGVLEMRPGSAFLRDLERDTDPWGAVEAYDFLSPFDLVIVPASHARLPRARATRVLAVQSHHDMILDPKVLAAVTETLRDECAAPEASGAPPGPSAPRADLAPPGPAAPHADLAPAP